MRTMTYSLKMISLSLALGALAACSGSNPAAPAAINAAGKHVVATGYSNWVQQHWVEYKKANGGSKAVTDTTGCSECHGADLAGGVSKVSCFSASFTDSHGAVFSCHPNGDHTLGHPASWGDPAGNAFHGAANFNGLAVKGSATLGTVCGLCHATSASETSLGSAPSCLSSDPKWGIACHSSSPAANSQGCVSCHGVPPVGAASAAPNRAGAHAVHLGLAAYGVTIGCSSCHLNGGSGSARHGAGNGLAYLNLSSGFRAQSVPFAYSAAKCSGVSCHGGQQTPAWATGHLTVDNDCSSCHALAGQGLPQYNDYHSGLKNNVNLHAFHLTSASGPGLTCVNCHAKLLKSVHFAGLNNPALGGAAATLSDEINYVPAAKTCATTAVGAVTCHPANLVLKWE
jgi:predicted CxxxxCH...CXXCH cytochrome family protein